MEKPYAKAPIIEAILDFGIEPLPGDSFASLRSMTSGESSVYDDVKDLNQFKVDVHVDETMSHTVPSRKVLGFICSDGQAKQAYQVRRDGFTYSKLAPYQSWDSFIGEGKRLWQLYRKNTAPAKITRLAVRFINRLDLPLPLADFKVWLRTVPEVAPELEQSLANMLLQYRTREDDIGAWMNFTEAIVQSPTPEICSVVLDIDLYRDFDVPQSEADIWKLFETFRLRKNKIFEASITDETRRLFD